MNDADRKSRPSETGAVNNPLPSLARADRRQREQNAAAVSPTYSPAAASPSKPGELRPIGLALTAIIAGLPVPSDLVKS